MKGAKILPLKAVLDMIHEIYEKKAIADAVDEEKGKEKDGLPGERRSTFQMNSTRNNINSITFTFVIPRTIQSFLKSI